MLPKLLEQDHRQRHAKAVVPKNLDQVTSGTSEDVKIARMRIALQRLLDLQRRPFMPRRMSVHPTASQTRTPEGTRIIAAPTHRAHAAAHLTIKAAGDADPVFAADLDLDLLRDDRRPGRDRILLLCNHHRNQ
jgi:hypothetical protein